MCNIRFKKKTVTVILVSFLDPTVSVKFATHLGKHWRQLSNTTLSIGVVDTMRDCKYLVPSVE